MYTDVGIQYINGENSEVIKYDTGKTFDVNVEISVQINEDINYIFISDSNTGNICFLRLNEDKTFKDIAKDTFGDEPKGYMISSTWDTTNDSKLKVRLDKESIEYLPEKADEYILDYSSSKVSANSYRQKYVMNKFNYFVAEVAKQDKKASKVETKTEEKAEEKKEETDNTQTPEETKTTNENVSKNVDTPKLQIIGVQNILYVNATSTDIKNDYKKAEGKVKTIFEIKDDKLVVVDVIVEK